MNVHSNHMKISTIGLDRERDIIGAINKWINSECESNCIMTINLPIIILFKIQQRVGWGNRSHFIRQRIWEYLELLEDRWGKPIPLFPSRSELIRYAIMDFFLHEEDIIIVKEEEIKDPIQNYLEKNGLKIIGEA